jgi:hypothetical protein
VNTKRQTTTTAVDATDCNSQPLLFPELICHKTVTVDYEGGEISSDGGGVLLGRLDRSYGYLQRFAGCFMDYRDEELIEHPVLDLLRQRIYGLALGYEDLNDHDQLRSDPLLAAVCGKEDPLGRERHREQDRGKALAGKSTLNRLELTPTWTSRASRYKKIQADPVGIEDYFINEFVRSLPRHTKQVVLDLDRTNDALHGNQEGRFYHGYYRQYCYTPFYIFCGDWPVVAALHTAESEHQDEVRRLVEKVVARLRQRFARIRIILRADSGYCRDELMSWCEKANVYYVFGLQKNAVLEKQLRGSLRKAKRLLDQQQTQSQRIYKDFRYRAKKWARRRRRVIGKAEWTAQGANPRFVITNLQAEHYDARELYEQIYCARGDMENRPDQHRSVMGQPTALVVFNAGLSVGQPTAAGGTAGYRDGPGHLRNDSTATFQDWRLGACDRSSGLDPSQQRLSPGQPVRLGRPATSTGSSGVDLQHSNHKALRKNTSRVRCALGQPNYDR